MMGWLNLGSLLLGLIAWILPVVSLLRNNKRENKSWIAFSILSMCACAISLFFQILYDYHLVKIEDWAALMDTTGGVVVAATVLLSITIILNVTTLIVYCGKIKKLV